MTKDTGNPLRVAVLRAGVARRGLSKKLSLAARGLLVGAFLPILAMILFGVARTPVGRAISSVGTIGILAAPVLLLAAWMASFSIRSTRDATIAIDGEGVRTEDGRLLVRRDDVASGIVVPRGPDWDVELEKRSGDVTQLRVADEAT